MLFRSEETDVIKRRGAWYSYKGSNFAQGREKAIAHMESNIDFAKEIEKQVRDKLSQGAVVSANSVARTGEIEEDEDEDEILEEE